MMCLFTCFIIFLYRSVLMYLELNQEEKEHQGTKEEPTSQCITKQVRKGRIYYSLHHCCKISNGVDLGYCKENI